MKLLVIIIVFLSFNINKSFSQNFISPCPSIFQYAYENTEWVGLMDLPGPRVGQSLYLRVELSIAAQLPTDYVGRIELVASTTETLLDITQGKPVRYRIRFPVPQPIPLVTNILLDNRVICRGPPATGNILTTINLDHTLYTKQTGGGFGSGANTGVSQYQPAYQQPSLVPVQPVQTPQYTEYPNYQQPALPSSLPTINQYEIPNNQLQFTSTPSKPEKITSQPSFRPETTQHSTSTSSNNNALSELSDICGQTEVMINPLILRGESTTRGDWPWTVPLFLSGNKGDLAFICSGTLISRKTVITAAHCVYTSEGNSFSVVEKNKIILSPGKFNIRDWLDGELTRADQIISHPDYRPAQLQITDADIAIIIMAKTFEFSAYIKPLCLWQSPSDIEGVIGRKGTVVGWGRDGSGSQTSAKPQLAKVPIVSQDTCRNSKDILRQYSTDRTFCAGARDGSGPCNGDSGGGLLLPQNGRWALRGIVSLSVNDIERQCDNNEFIIYTDVPKFSDWLLQNVQ